MNQAPAQPRSRLAELLSSVPLITLCMVSICSVVYIADNLFDFNANTSAYSSELLTSGLGSQLGCECNLPTTLIGLTVSAFLVIWEWQWYRIISAAFTHLSILHILMNMMAMYQLGSSLEPMFGTLQYFFVIVVFTLAVGLGFIIINLLLALLWDQSYLFQSAAGASGVIFAMAVDESSLSSAPTRSIFGFFSVPTKLYPWVLMLLIQLVMPQASLIGHLAGILVGTLHSMGAFRWAIPSLVTLRKVEESPWMRFIVRLGPYKLVPASDVLRESTSLRSTCASAGALALYVLQPAIDCVRGLTASARRNVPAVLPTQAAPPAVMSGSARAAGGGGRTLGGGPGPASAAGAAAAARYAALSAAQRGSGLAGGGGGAAAPQAPAVAAADPASTGSAAGGVLGSASDALARASGLTPDTRYARLTNETEEDAAAAGV